MWLLAQRLRCPSEDGETDKQGGLHCFAWRNTGSGNPQYGE